MTTFTRRPRNVGALQAASILYGDWGTSKAYVIGLAFAIAGYSSFWLIAAVTILTALVGLNYITICKYNPTGGGVYASVRRKSEIISLIAAFFLIADYLVTAAISAQASFEYLGVDKPQYWSIASVLIVGCINAFGPRHSGNLAFLVAIPAIISVVLIGFAFIPYIPNAIQSLEPLSGGFQHNWINFVSIIVALSGIESIANTTGVMKLDPGTTEENPSVKRTARRSILIVMLEVCLFTALLGFAANALPDLRLSEGHLYAPDGESIRDDLLRYMGQYFATERWGEIFGISFGTFIRFGFGILLLSAVNTAIVAMVQLIFVMSRDGELPQIFQKINRYGVPLYALAAATLVPIVILFFVHDIASLANLYAVGFVGAIATNLGATALDKELPLTKVERSFMFPIFIVMAVIEVSLFIYKPDARRFVLTIVAVGLFLRAFVIEQRQKVWANKKIQLQHAPIFTGDVKEVLHEGAILCATNTVGKTLSFAMDEANKANQMLYLLFIKDQKIITEEDHLRIWLDDEKACAVFDFAKDSAEKIKMKFLYAISDDPARTIVDMAADLKVSRIIMGKSRRSTFINMIRGNIIREVSEICPPDMDLLVIS